MRIALFIWFFFLFFCRASWAQTVVNEKKEITTGQAELQIPEVVTGRVKSIDRNEGAVVLADFETGEERIIKVDARTLIAVKPANRLRVNLKKDEWKAERVFIYDERIMLKQSEADGK